MENYIGVKLDGRYELLELIGSGGMAEIYKAEDTQEEKIVAVKILKNEFAGSEDFLRRFRNESKAIALLSHPNIVKIFDVGFTESVQFIVMEYIDGKTLTDYIAKRSVLKWREALNFVGQILKALQHAHDRGIVHRDIKSQNVMLLKDGTIKVMDFGIARFNREIDKTMSEKAIGSVHYISPEQARGGVTDEKSDIYSVGIMLYEMLTGEKPFDGDNALAIAHMHANTAPKPPREIEPSIPEGLEEITLRAMQKNPANRYQTAGEMISDLKELEKNPNAIFEYKYFTPDGNAKRVDKLGNPAPVPVPKKPAAVRQVDYDDEDDYDDDYDDDEVVERRSPLLPILFAVASVFVIMAAVLIYMIATRIIDPPVDDPGGVVPVKNLDMPMLIGQDYNAVIAEWGDKINFEVSQEYSSEYSKNTVMWQELAEGRKINSSVGIIVSKGPDIVYLTDYQSGGPYFASTVADELAGRGLVVRKKFDEHPTIPKDYVISTDPPGGSALEKGDTVILHVSVGATGGETPVPDMVGMTITALRANVDNYEITLVEVFEESSEEDRDKVLSQSIDPTTKVPKWTEVEVVVGGGPPATRSAYLEFDVGTKRKGDYTFLYYIEGALVDSVTIDLELKHVIKWEFEGEGENELYSIKIRNESNGETALFCTYEINFTVDPVKKTEVYSDPKVFSKINGSAPETDPPKTDPPETDEPDYDEEDEW